MFPNVNTHILSANSIILRQPYNRVPCDLGGNGRSNIALVMHHKLNKIPIYRLSSLTEGDEHPAYLRMNMAHI